MGYLTKVQTGSIEYVEGGLEHVVDRVLGELGDPLGLGQ